MIDFFKDLVNETPKEQYKIEGKASFIVKPFEYFGKLPYHTCSVELKAYDKNENNSRVVINTKWYRVIGGRNYLIDDLNDIDLYNFSALDIGCEIRCLVKGKDPKYKGSLTITFAKCKFDDSQKQS